MSFLFLSLPTPPTLLLCLKFVSRTFSVIQSKVESKRNIHYLMMTKNSNLFASHEKVIVIELLHVRITTRVSY